MVPLVGVSDFESRPFTRAVFARQRTIGRV